MCRRAPICILLDKMTFGVFCPENAYSALRICLSALRWHVISVAYLIFEIYKIVLLLIVLIVCFVDVSWAAGMVASSLHRILNGASAVAFGCCYGVLSLFVP